MAETAWNSPIAGDVATDLDAPVPSPERMAAFPSSWRNHARSEPADAAQDVGEQITRKV